MARISDKDTRIAILGGGVSGLTSAFWLKEKGYRDITIFEKESEVGGKVCSFTHPETGGIYEVGACIQSADFKTIYELAQRAGFTSTSAGKWLKKYPTPTIVVDKNGELVSSFLGYRTPVSRHDLHGPRHTLAEELPEITITDPATV